MTVKELIEELSEYSDNASVEVAILPKTVVEKTTVYCSPFVHYGIFENSHGICSPTVLIEVLENEKSIGGFVRNAQNDNEWNRLHNLWKGER